MKVAIFFGSKSDIDVMKGAGNALKEFGIPYNAYILSAHRVPEKLIETLEKIEKEGCEVIIAGAGLVCSSSWSYSFSYYTSYNRSSSESSDRRGNGCITINSSNAKINSCSHCWNK